MPPFGKLETAIRDTELPGNLAHELFLFIRWQQFLPSWRNPFNLCRTQHATCCCSPFLGGFAGVLRLSRLRSVARGGRVVCWVFYACCVRVRSSKAGQITLGRCSLSSVVAGAPKTGCFGSPSAAVASGSRSSDLLPYSLRRGGATCRLARFESTD